MVNWLDDGSAFIVAPEALNKFYVKGFSGKLGVTWMTKEDRLHEIEDYCCFLQKVYDEVTSGIPEKVEITLLGFSQGCRWAAIKKPRISKQFFARAEFLLILIWEMKRIFTIRSPAQNIDRPS